MAIVRCEKCGLDFSRTTHSYHRTPIKPVGFPNTAAICGKTECCNPGMLWLQQDEYEEYGRGQ